MKLRLPKRRVWRVAIYLVSLALVAIALDLVWVEMRRTIHPGYDTTRIVKPTLPDGSIDYLATMEDFFSRGVTPENNAAIPLFQALGPVATPRTQPRDGITNRMGMPHLEEKGDYYISHEEYWHDHPAEEDEDLTEIDARYAWPVTIKPATAEWIDANEKPLALIVEASKRSHYFVPFNGGNRPTSLITVLIPHVGRLHGARRALLTRALIRLEKDDVAGFQSDVSAGHRLARLFAQDSTIVGRLVGLVWERSTCQIERIGINSGKVPAAQMHEMLSDLTSMEKIPQMTDAVDYSERMMGLDAMQVLARANPQQREEMFNGLFGANASRLAFRFWPISYDDCMRSLNQFHDAAIVAMRRPSYADRVEAFKLYNQQLELMSHENYFYRFLSSDWPPLLLIPALLKATEKVDSARLDGQLTQVSLALALYKSDRGEYPAALSELAPKYLPVIPQDYFSEKSLIYSRGEKGYVLYSVGPNMVDDRGAKDDLIASLNR